jgi:hypothetical protein
MPVSVFSVRHMSAARTWSCRSQPRVASISVSRSTQLYLWLEASAADIPVSAKPERCAGGGQASAALIVVWQGALDGGPERGCMARLADVGEFVDDDVVDQGRR